MIKAIILDAYGTVFSTGTSSVDAVARILTLNGRNDLDPREVYFRLKELHRERIAGLTEFLPEAEMFALDMDQLHREYKLSRDPAKDTQVLLSIQGTRTAFPDSRVAIERLQKQIPVVLGSTTDTKPLLTDLHRAGIVPDGIFTSESLRIYKPSELFYTSILKALDLSPKEALFAGDSLLDDVLGPQRVGMKTCWITRKNEGRTKRDPLPDYRAETLLQLLSILLEQGYLEPFT